ncbi:hypothetical protein ED733_006875 [Metarhizium rileyi]|uniref:GPI anchored protein n=1 Tax=Metarhizium rileyi (strain RCEF 4871) TaxID=1649241 RepID=A0A5C6GCF3_METRR|nr:hypothetical protein ED733_006875 [Metarhizium rileyi]
MRPAPAILALVGLVAADSIRFESMTSSLVGDLGALSPRALDTCDVGTACGSGCLPIGSSCCSRSQGTYCSVGYRCYTYGCCPLGKNCSGPPVGGCQGDRVECGKVCRPKGSECCSQITGAFCRSGTSCVSTTRCNGPQQSGSGSGSGSGSSSSSSSSSSSVSGSDVATSDILGGVTTTTQGSDVTNTYSLSPSTNTADSNSNSGTGFGSDSSSGSGDSTRTTSGASPTDDQKSHPPTPGGAGAIHSSGFLLGLLAAVPLLL